MKSTYKEYKERYEDWLYRKDLEDKGEAPIGLRQGMNPFDFLSFIEGAKSLEELVGKIDEYDPYNYRIIYIYAGAIYQGLKIKVQFYKGKEKYIVPKEYARTIYIPIAFQAKRKIWFTIIKKKKLYDSNRSLRDPFEGQNIS